MSPTLESILELKHNHPLYHDFILYSQQTYCLENLLFYQDVQDYRSKPTTKKFNCIISRYIQVNSPQEINIPCEMRQFLLQKDVATTSTFDEAVESILELIRVNSFLPWWYQQHHHTTTTSRRNTLTPSLSVPEHRWQHLFTSRPSFTSLRNVELVDRHNQQKKKKLLGGGGNLFQRKRQAIMIRVKKAFDSSTLSEGGFSWLANK